MAGLTPLTPHALRHTAAAILIDQGTDPLQVQRRLGHKDISTTLRIYGHLFPDRDLDLTRRLDDAFHESLAAPSRPEPVAMVIAE
ncbi:MAG: tyrosine-type recombinase/integrase [Actinobacteria bacterium]|nr:tyrosine-type recombinase/integrase [Actinomycetota bacterium]